MENAIRTRNVQDIAELVATQKREVIGSKYAFPLARQSIHLLGIASRRWQRSAMHQRLHIRRNKNHGRATDLNARVSNALHFTYSGNCTELLRHRSRKAETARCETLRCRNK